MSSHVIRYYEELLENRNGTIEQVAEWQQQLLNHYRLLTFNQKQLILEQEQQGPAIGCSQDTLSLLLQMLKQQGQTMQDLSLTVGKISLQLGQLQCKLNAVMNKNAPIYKDSSS